MAEAWGNDTMWFNMGIEHGEERISPGEYREEMFQFFNDKFRGVEVLVSGTATLAPKDRDSGEEYEPSFEACVSFAQKVSLELVPESEIDVANVLTVVEKGRRGRKRYHCHFAWAPSRAQASLGWVIGYDYLSRVVKEVHKGAGFSLWKEAYFKAGWLMYLSKVALGDIKGLNEYWWEMR